MEDLKGKAVFIRARSEEYKENIRAIMGGETEKLFTSYFRDYLEQTFYDDLNPRSEVPKDFALNFLQGAFAKQ